MANRFNSGTSARIQAIFDFLNAALGVDFTFSRSAGFKVTLEVAKNGEDVVVQGYPLDQGPSIPTEFVAGGNIDPDGLGDYDIGTATMVASTIDVTVPGGVPTGANVYATVTTPGGKPKKLTAVRKDADEITVSSAGSGFGELLDSAGVTGVLVAGEKADIALANVAGDLLAVKQTVAGGGAADHFSVVRVSDALVKVQAHDAAGALVATNTSTVKAYNFGQAAHETSVVRWAVQRPVS